MIHLFGFGVRLGPRVVVTRALPNNPYGVKGILRCSLYAYDGVNVLRQAVAELGYV